MKTNISCWINSLTRASAILLPAAAATVVLCGNTVEAQAPYSYTNIADSSGVLGTFGSAPSINAAGDVAFAATLDSKPGNPTLILAGSGGMLTTIADDSGVYAYFYGAPAINAAGTVAFLAALNGGGYGIFTRNGAATTTISAFGVYSNFSMNDAGTVAFETENYIPGQASTHSIYTGNGITTTPIVVTTGQQTDVFRTVGSPAIDAAGTVSFFGIVNAGDERGIFTSNGGSATKIATNQTFSGVGGSAGSSINDAGRVAFSWAKLSSGEGGIYTGTGADIATVADYTGAYSYFADPPSINGSGSVAFLTLLDDGGSGIFTGSNSITNKVIRNGDALFGSTVTNLQMFSTTSLNDAGQIAFIYALADGRQGVARANPVPEPSAVFLISSGALIGLALRKVSRSYKTRQVATSEQANRSTHLCKPNR